MFLKTYRSLNTTILVDKYFIMDHLFSHPGFRLIFIDDDGNMSLKTPHEDGSKEDIIEKGYCCISHYWGPKPSKWEDHPVKGVSWGVHIREEKRTRLLQIFNHHKGYFWMDVFCTDQSDINKPLDIMGDIYRNCKECVCLLDYICEIDTSINEKDMLANLVKDIEELPRGAEGLWGIPHSKGEWFNRVWTWQEAALPPKLLFCYEQDRGHKYDPFDHEYLEKMFPYKFMKFPTRNVSDMLSVGYEMMKLDMCYDAFEQLFPIMRIMSFNEKHDIWNNVMRMYNSHRKCTNEEDYIYGITGILNIFIPKGLTLQNATTELDRELRKQGMFVEYDTEILPGNGLGLGNLFKKKDILDGVMVLGKVDALEFGPNVKLIYEDYGKVLERKNGNLTCLYRTETICLSLKNTCNVGDTIGITIIGRKGCTFEKASGFPRDEQIYILAGNGVVKA
jgi:hypothetical protein